MVGDSFGVDEALFSTADYLISSRKGAKAQRYQVIMLSVLAALREKSYSNMLYLSILEAQSIEKVRASIKIG